MKKTITILLIILVGLNDLYSQWNDSGSNLTTTDNVSIKPSSSGQTNTNVSGLFVENAGSNDAYYVFQTATIGGGKSFSITNAGNVGIGTTTPVTKFDVEGGDFYLGEEVNGNGQRRQIRIYGYDNNSKFYGTIHSNWEDFRRTFDIYTDAATQQIKIDASANSSAPITLLPGASSGVGIGTNNPDMALTVQGSVNVGGTANGTLKVRHLEGKDHQSAGYGHLLLNYSSPHPVVVGTPSNHVDLSVYGEVGIGGNASVPSGYKLAVDGKGIMEEVQVAMSGNWPDYVFSDTYQLNPLSEVSTYIEENHHLPGIPTAEEVAENGIKLGEMNAKLLEKVEELTLYLIEQERRIDEQQEVINQLIKENK